jgi:hypothetical protein
MADTYEMSYLNIAATRASDGSQGCLPLTSHRVTGASKILVQPNSSLSAEETITRSSPEENSNRYGSFTFEPELWTGEVETAPLLTRGWVLQEVVLAPRVLHCGENQLFWECSELRASEDYPDGIPGLHTFKDTMSASKSSNWKGQGDLWHHIVHRYSKLDLTFPEKDKLVAVQGLSKRVTYNPACPTTYKVESMENYDSQYLYGLWRSNLTHDLLWCVAWNSDTWDDRVLAAPSWSWASCNQPVWYFHHSINSFSFDAATELGSVMADIDSKKASKALSMTACIGSATYAALQTILVDTIEWIAYFCCQITWKTMRTRILIALRHSVNPRVSCIYQFNIKGKLTEVGRKKTRKPNDAMCKA